MKLKIAWIGNAKPGNAKPGNAKPGNAKPGKQKSGQAKPGKANLGNNKDAAIQSLTDEYLDRLSHYADVEGRALKDEAALLALSAQASRPQFRHTLIALDSRGRQISSEQLAKFIGDYQARNPLPLLFAIGPASGFSQEALRSAHMIISLGPMTIAHELARVVLLEQLYRAFTILQGHPYHLGH